MIETHAIKELYFYMIILGNGREKQVHRWMASISPREGYYRDYIENSLQCDHSTHRLGLE